MHTVFARYSHCICTVFKRHSHCIRTVFALFSHGIHTVFAQAEVVRLLLERGADVSARTITWNHSVFGKDSGFTPAHWAAESGHDEVLRVLHASSAQVVAFEDERGRAPLAVAKGSACKDILSKACEDEYVALALSVSYRESRGVQWPSRGEGEGRGVEDITRQLRT
jgi:hypothetical protein